MKTYSYFGGLMQGIGSLLTGMKIPVAHEFV